MALALGFAEEYLPVRTQCPVTSFGFSFGEEIVGQDTDFFRNVSWHFGD